MYRLYHSHSLSYLHDRPKSDTIHCLDRQTNSSKILADNIHDVDSKNGVFEVEKPYGSKHRVDFGISSSEPMPSCTCKDWLRHHIPCKHFFAIFTHQSVWQWNKLPQTYLQSAYLSTDTQALQNYFHSSTDDREDLSITDTETHPSAESSTTATNLPKPVNIHKNVLTDYICFNKHVGTKRISKNCRRTSKNNTEVSRVIDVLVH